MVDASSDKVALETAKLTDVELKDSVTRDTLINEHWLYRCSLSTPKRL